MPDYKKMYFKLLEASQAAIDALIEAQLECEALCALLPEPELQVLPPPPRDKKDPAAGPGLDSHL